MQCIKCGKELVYGEKVCSQCGTPKQVVPVQAPARRSSGMDAEQIVAASRARLLFALITVAAVVVLLITAVSIFKPKPPSPLDKVLGNWSAVETVFEGKSERYEKSDMGYKLAFAGKVCTVSVLGASVDCDFRVDETGKTEIYKEGGEVVMSGEMEKDGRLRMHLKTTSASPYGGESYVTEYDVYFVKE